MDIRIIGDDKTYLYEHTKFGDIERIRITLQCDLVRFSNSFLKFVQQKLERINPTNSCHFLFFPFTSSSKWDGPFLFHFIITLFKDQKNRLDQAKMLKQLLMSMKKMVSAQMTRNTVRNNKYDLALLPTFGGHL